MAPGTRLTVVDPLTLSHAGRHHNRQYLFTTIDVVQHTHRRRSFVTPGKTVRSMLSPIRANQQISVTFEKRPVAINRHASAKTARPTGIAHQAVAIDAYRVIALCLFDGNVAGNVGWVAKTVVPVPIGPSAPSARQKFVINETFARYITVPTDDDQ